MAGQRKRYSAELKTRVALEAIKGHKTANEIAAEYGVHPTQIAQWKKQALDGLPTLFSTRASEQQKSEEGLIATLYQQIGQLKVQVDWLEKNPEHCIEAKRALIEPGHPELSIVQQCELLGLARSTYDYEPVPESEENLLLMRLLDEQYTRTPFYGTRKMAAWLHTQGFPVDRKRVRRLLRLMGLEAIYPKPRTSVPGLTQQRYPYLLQGMSIEHCNQVWSCDITYIRLARGFIYLMAVIDWFSRYVLSWEISITLDTSFCLEALDRALRVATPEIFNTDQGVQFSSAEFTNRLKAADVRISWDGRGRAFDNIFVERLWRSVKYEEVYLKDYQSVADAVSNLRAYFTFYNHERLHQALDYQTPAQVYSGH
jgi:putative transposase